MFNIWLLDIQHHSRNVYYGALFSLFLFTIHVDNCLLEIVTQKWHLFIFMHTHIQMKKWRYYNIRRQIYTNCTVVETPMSLWYANQTTSERNSIKEGCLLILRSWYSLMMTFLQRLHQTTHVVISISDQCW